MEKTAHDALERASLASCELGDVQTIGSSEQKLHSHHTTSNQNSKQTTIMSKPETYRDWNRWQQLEFLLETMGQDFKNDLLDKIVSSMTDKEFAETYDYICRTEGIARDYQELQELEHTNSVFEPQLID